ncbi:hypothetical protein SAMN05421777_10794 [Fluoribacter gormanii]|uniref:Uncharacterized protein n=1 Tax=Fluoribacter gormanii TaxID=464 RepID=A0A377GPH0_9GAMM|nr:hypothetical protein SAMN05421777_10794 [Fluoribacter gormanii]STO26222.1 Uncharacterised protein [Fluoribacter gormanii]
MAKLQFFKCCADRITDNVTEQNMDIDYGEAIDDSLT